MKDADFPFLFAQDADGSAIEAFGGKIRDNGMTLERAVVVIDPEGKIHAWMTPFAQVDPASYDKLQALIAEVAPELDEGEEDADAEVAEAVEALHALESGGACD